MGIYVDPKDQVNGKQYAKQVESFRFATCEVCEKNTKINNIYRKNFCKNCRKITQTVQVWDLWGSDDGVLASLRKGKTT